MRRPLAVMAVLLVLSGCKGTSPSASSADPFFGRTRIEPPATGTLAVPRAQGASSATSQGAAVQALAGAAAVPTGSTPGQLQAAATGGSVATSPAPPGDVIAIPASARSAPELLASRTASVGPSAAGSSPAVSPASSSSSPPVAASNNPAPYEKTVRSIATRGKPAEQVTQDGTIPGLPSSWPTPQPVVVPQKAVNITELPAAHSSRGSQSSSSASPQAVVLASATEPITEGQSAGSGNASATGGGRYAYEPSYQWLSGKLEYSQIDRTWRLRYIPIDGATDKYGGSVILSPTAKLSGLERGQFVRVSGRLTSAPSDGKTFAAGYEVSDISRP